MAGLPRLQPCADWDEESKEEEEQKEEVEGEEDEDTRK